MPLLLTKDELLDRVTISQSADIDKAVVAALKATTVVMESELRTAFARSTFVDTFEIINGYQSDPTRGDRRQWPDWTRGLTPRGPQLSVPLLLTRGFVQTTPVVSVQMALEPYLFDDPDSVTDLRSHPDDQKDHARINYQRGTVVLEGLDLSRTYVRVSYTAGLVVGSEEVYEDVPDWLKEAAAMYCQVALDANPVIRRENQAGADVEGLKGAVAAMLQPYVRYEPLAIVPS